MTATHAGVIGHPVSHSLSPVIHQAAYEAAGIDWDYRIIDVEPGDVSKDVKALFANGFKGLSVTMPHKDAAFQMCDVVHGSASRLKTVNALICEDGSEIHGYSTDGDGFVASLASEGFAVSEKNILVIGAGGAARAICDSLFHAGARVVVAARSKDASEKLCEMVCHAPSAGDVSGAIETIDFSLRNESILEADIVVNATPIGMTKDGETDEEFPVDPSLCSQGQIVVDTIYNPLETPFLAAVRAQGCVAYNGIGMLLHQAALAFTLMTHIEAPIEAMRDALEKEVHVRMSKA